MNWLADSKPGEEAETKTLLVALLVCVCVCSNSAHVPGKSRQDSWLLCI